MKKSTAPEPGPVKESLPTRLEVKIHSLRTDGPVLAHASVTLNGCSGTEGGEQREWAICLHAAL